MSKKSLGKTNNLFPSLAAKSSCFYQLPLSHNLELLIGLPGIETTSIITLLNKNFVYDAWNCLMTSVNFTSAEKSCLIFSLSLSHVNLLI